jgi:cell division protein FtsB
MIAIGVMTGEFEAIADVATGALVAGSVDGAHGRPGHSDESKCLNCGTPLIGPHCHRCGQAAHVHRTVMALFHDIAHGVFHLEGRTWHTLPLLFWRPGELTRRYAHGERANFVSPMALFLFSVFLMVATFSAVGGLTGHKGEQSKAEASRQEASKDLAAANADLAKLRARKQALQAKGADLTDVNEKITNKLFEIAGLRLVMRGQISPDVANAPGDGDNDIRTGLPAVDQVVSHAVRNPELAAYKLQSSAYKFSWALIPISLPFIWLLFAFRRDVGMYDHAIFATYSLSAMTLMVVILSLGAAIGIWPALIWLTLLFFPPFHMYRQLKGAYGLRRFGAIWRMIALIIAAYTSALIFFIVLIAMGLSG